jgi:hypothetical protein
LFLEPPDGYRIFSIPILHQYFLYLYTAELLIPVLCIGSSRLVNPAIPLQNDNFKHLIKTPREAVESCRTEHRAVCPYQVPSSSSSIHWANWPWTLSRCCNSSSMHGMSIFLYKFIVGSEKTFRHIFKGRKLRFIKLQKLWAAVGNNLTRFLFLSE